MLLLPLSYLPQAIAWNLRKSNRHVSILSSETRSSVPLNLGTVTSMASYFVLFLPAFNNKPLAKSKPRSQGPFDIHNGDTILRPADIVGLHH